jgi:release factor glutamine methyltransferase
MKTLGEVLLLSAGYLKERSVLSPRLSAEELLAFVLKLKRLDLYMLFDRPLDENELTTYRALLKRRAGGEPVEYITGEVEFASCHFEITPACIIPRQETEILFHDALIEIKKMEKKSLVAWDVCCGSGCLGIALKKKMAEIEVTLSDISDEALALARKNSEKNGVDLSFLKGDLLAPFEGKRADIVFCNPPYITEGEFPDLSREVRDFEPKRALVSGPTGLEFYQRLSRDLPRYLNPGAKVFFELGTGQGSALLELFSAPCWTRKNVKKDWADHDRFFFLEFE